VTTTVEKRRETRIAGIVACAWELARVQGIAGVSLHALARSLGIRQPSLYEYFASKNDLYDTMFADGNRQLIGHLNAVRLSRDPRTALKQVLGAFTAFALGDPARYELLFQRHIPGFTPTPESYAFAEEVLERVVTFMRSAGVTRQSDVDCIVAVTAGLIEAQISNDPGGHRWARHLNRLIDLLVEDAITRSTNET
jgi:AcrR family transcriptional regulator